MKKIKYFFLVVLLIVLVNDCKKETTEKFQSQRNNIVKAEIKDILTEFTIGRSIVAIVGDILLVIDIQSTEEGIHLFNKNNFKYITTTGRIGKGPGEIVRYGTIGIDNKNNVFYMTDYGKDVLWRFNIDSILNNKEYMPEKVGDLPKDMFMGRFDILNDSIFLGKAIDVINYHTYTEVFRKFNIKSNKSTEFGYQHPETKKGKASSYIKISKKHDIYINCYYADDLMTICDLNGNLKYNIYGPDWGKNKNGRKHYYTGVDIFNDYIIASYSGKEIFRYDEYKRLKTNFPTKFLIFDIKGNYMKTIETGYEFHFFCIDEENKRVIAYFEDRENPLGYFNLDIP